MILLQKKRLTEKTQSKSILNGIIEQDLDLKTDSAADLKVMTKRAPSKEEVDALLFASKICKHTKSNTIILAINGQLLASGAMANSSPAVLVRLRALTHYVRQLKKQEPLALVSRMP
jgi:AICAR transformylase/IMP cyclohydrolase PurH